LSPGDDIAVRLVVPTEASLLIGPEGPWIDVNLT
jgi:hypothetical protein